MNSSVKARLRKLLPDLSSLERLKAVLSASARGDSSERDALAASAPLVTSQDVDYAEMGERFLRTASVVLLDLLDLQRRVLALEAVDWDELDGPGRMRLEQTRCLYGAKLIVRYRAWEKVCGSLGTTVAVSWEPLPGSGQLVRYVRELDADLGPVDEDTLAVYQAIRDQVPVESPGESIEGIAEGLINHIVKG